MRYLNLIFAALLLSISCRQAPLESRLEINPAEIHAPKEGGEFIVNISGPAYWITDNTADWIDISKKDDAAVVNIKKNTGHERCREITFSSIYHSAVLHILQERSDAFSVTPTSVRFPCKGGTSKISLDCYSPWEASTDCEWIYLEPASGESPATVQVTGKQSFDRYERNGTVTFACGERTLTVGITQSPSPYVEVEQNTVEIDGDGGQRSVLYISNTDIEISTNVQWIRLIDRPLSDKTISFEVLRNPGESRSGSITISSADDPEYTKTITVMQGEKIDHPSFHFEEGVHMDISQKGTFALHPVFIDMQDTTLVWSSGNPAVASTDDSGNITVHTGGTCTITARNPFHNVSASISLNIRIKAESMHVRVGSQDMDANPTAVRFAGETLSVSVSLVPEDAYSGDIVCNSSDAGIAKTNGMQIMCISPGKTVIYVESLYHGLMKSFDLIILED
jgi:uncharacterized protein YjdB